jgi:uncharacterized protein
MPYLPTGNEFIALPTLRSEDACVESLNLLHAGLNGLVSFAGLGTPLLRPVLRVDGREVPLEARLTWRRLADWVPEFRMQGEGFVLTGAWVCPPGDRSFFLRLKFENQGSVPAAVTLGFQASWAECLHSVNVTKRLECGRYLILESWDDKPALELRGPGPLAALAFYPTDPKATFTFKIGGDPLLAPRKVHRRGFPAQGTDEVFVSGKSSGEALPGCVWETAFFFGLGPDEIGALTSAREGAREGAEQVERRAAHWLAARCRTIPDGALAHTMNLNAFFNRFFATGLTLDTEQAVALTSRSPRYYVSGAYWDRDTLLWSLPSLLVQDAPWARKVLEYVFGVQGRNFGVHSRCLNGAVLEPGFELDEWCAPMIALARYVDVTNDLSLLGLPSVRAYLDAFERRLEEKKHPKAALYETWLLPSDDPWPQRYVTYDNVLVWRSCTDLAALWKRLKNVRGARAASRRAAQVKQAVLRHCVVQTRKGRVFAWSVDLSGNHLLNDEPPGSLLLLPYYGFCGLKDPVWCSTADWIGSEGFPYSFKGCSFEAEGCLHAPHPWVLAAVNRLLSGDKERGASFLKRAAMDGGVACESVDETTGECATGEAFATCAGFVAYGLWKAFGERNRRKS